MRTNCSRPSDIEKLLKFEAEGHIEKLLIFEAEGHEFSKSLRSLENSIEEWKVRTIFEKKNIFNLLLEVSQI